MKKLIISFLLIALLSLVGAIFLIAYKAPVKEKIFKEHIYLKNGDMIIADSSSKGGKLLYYKQGNTTNFILKKNIKHIEKIEMEESASDKRIKIFREHVRKIKSFTPDLFKPDLYKPDLFKKENFKGKFSASLPEIVSNNISSAAFIILILFFICITVIIVKKMAGSGKILAQDQTDNAAQKNDIATLDEDTSFFPNPETRDITRFFLSVFKQQLGALEDAPEKITPTESDSINSKFTYELGAEKNDKWESRRITVGRLGEESGSKSKCFFVIYDIYIVIKIPPVQTDDFNEYIESIKKEKLIVDKLAPKKCIVPKVSVILEKIRKLPGGSTLTQQEREDKYIHLLTRNPSLQSYLKIGKGFVYFMDLSQYFFLGDILSKNHNIDAKTVEEITLNPEIIWDIKGFEGRYGKDKEQICLDIKDVYITYENEISKLLEKSGTSNIHDFKVREWFLLHLAGKQDANIEKDLPQDFIDDLNELLTAVERNNRAVLEAYRKMIEKHVAMHAFIQTKSRISGIITNLLDLLAWLTEKGVAIRDLKPDNLFVAGDPEKYPEFLTSWEKYQIGLIDVETAVDFSFEDPNRIKQPILGGTPFYATPAHLLENVMLGEVFGNFTRILNLQDWHAVIAMIYEVVVGEILFQHTGPVLRGMVSQIRDESLKDSQQICAVFQDISRIFWQQALTELKRETGKNKKRLEAIKVKVPGIAVKMLTANGSDAQETLDNMIEKYITSQTVFRDKKSQQQLIKAPSGSIKKLIIKWKKKDNLPAKATKHRRLILQALSGLVRLKLQAEQLTRTCKKLEQPNVKLHAYDLIEFMFHIVLNFMYQEQWGDISLSYTADFDDAGSDTQHEATILSSKETILDEATVKEKSGSRGLPLI